MFRDWWWSPNLNKTIIWKQHSRNVYSTQEWNSSPNICLPWKATLAFFPPWLLLGLGVYKPLAVECSLGPDCVQGIFLASISLQAHSLMCRSLSWLENAFFPQVENSSIKQTGANMAWWRSHKHDKTSGGGLPATYIQLSNGPQPQCGFTLESNPSLFPNLGLS